MKSEMILEFDINAIQDLSYWIKVDRERILKLIKDVSKNPFEGLGKPEPLKFFLSGYWSRRIDHEHRPVYSMETEKIRILSCRFHY